MRPWKKRARKPVQTDRAHRPLERYSRSVTNWYDAFWMLFNAELTNEKECRIYDWPLLLWKLPLEGILPLICTFHLRSFCELCIQFQVTDRFPEATSLAEKPFWLSSLSCLCSIILVFRYSLLGVASSSLLCAFVFWAERKAIVYWKTRKAKGGRRRSVGAKDAWGSVSDVSGVCWPLLLWTVPALILSSEAYVFVELYWLAQSPVFWLRLLPLSFFGLLHWVRNTGPRSWYFRSERSEPILGHAVYVLSCTVVLEWVCWYYLSFLGFWGLVVRVIVLLLLLLFGGLVLGWTFPFCWQGFCMVGRWLDVWVFGPLLFVVLPLIAFVWERTAANSCGAFLGGVVGLLWAFIKAAVGGLWRLQKCIRQCAKRLGGGLREKKLFWTEVGELAERRKAASASDLLRERRGSNVPGGDEEESDVESVGDESSVSSGFAGEGGGSTREGAAGEEPPGEEEEEEKASSEEEDAEGHELPHADVHVQPSRCCTACGAEEGSLREDVTVESQHATHQEAQKWGSVEGGADCQSSASSPTLRRESEPLASCAVEREKTDLTGTGVGSLSTEDERNRDASSSSSSSSAPVER
uniref:Transmembrane protein n=1 Tax=Chromera velia CCMP2878 TaxID=1169474 RepID=A0A0G4I2I0_9ALVE|eukprot:Cvel_10371.t1-p1 / transcript=Cvel_10371.t1 / gene=Cvel_10371 / organism=Chromera_velia_CCMP2878 / gene_product=hypothetical protein / transcript_product=hypothetical protein / location=Cvel_scaffold624:56026-58746(+) / protein_length=580 / sequence_SO=supercontig / SO=protein_coding / is_pseudo=false